MCHFITLIVPTGTEHALAGVMQVHGRVAIPVQNPSLATVLQADDRQFLTTRNCDCGTALFRTDPRTERKTNDAKAAKPKRKGWSDAKIARSQSNQSVSRAHKETVGRPLDSLEMWSDIISDVFGTLKAGRIGIHLHFYGGDIETELLAPSVRHVGKGAAILDALMTLTEDEVLTFAGSHL